jgi:CRP-like cAMP-binding protein
MDATPNKPTRHLKKGELLFNQGAPSDLAYRVVSGLLEASREHGEDGRSTLGQIGAGAFVGELGVLQGTPRSASIHAIEETELELYSRERFIESVTQNSEEAIELIKTLSFRTRSFFDLIDQLIEDRRSHAWQQQFGQIFQSVFGLVRKHLVAARTKQNDRVAVSVGEHGSTQIFEPGSTLFHEGTPSVWAARVIRGRLQARKKVELDWVILGEIGEENLVGELGLLQSRPRSATVIALEESELEILSLDQLFASLSGDSQRGYRAILDLSNRSIRLAGLLTEIANHDDLSDSVVPGRINSVLGSVEDVVHLARDLVIHDLKRLQRGLKSEARSVRKMFGIYQHYLRQEASEEDMEEANAAFRNLLKTLGMGTMFLLPGAVITIPLVVKLGQRFGIELMPKLDLDPD